ncbi:MAG TPA: permease prefix domain 1-containing protein [Acidobacteriaceae bacterium]
MRWPSSSRRNHEHDLDREVAFHIDALARDYEAAGMAPDQARRRASIDFGGREQITQQLREVHLSALVEAVRANTRAAFRFLRKAPGLSAAVVLTLALGIGANAAVFSAIDAVILRPLSFPQGGPAHDHRAVRHQGQIARQLRCAHKARGLEPPQPHLPGAHWLLHPGRIRDLRLAARTPQ